MSLAGRRGKEGRETVELIRKAGGEAVFVKTDVTREGEIRVAVEAALRRSPSTQG